MICKTHSDSRTNESCRNQHDPTTLQPTPSLSDRAADGYSDPRSTAEAHNEPDAISESIRNDGTHQAIRRHLQHHRDENAAADTATLRSTVTLGLDHPA